jgi:hypothetical protein
VLFGAEPGAVGVIFAVNEACPGWGTPGMDSPFWAACAACAASLAATSSFLGRPRRRFAGGVAIWSPPAAAAAGIWPCPLVCVGIVLGTAIGALS